MFVIAEKEGPEKIDASAVNAAVADANVNGTGSAIVAGKVVLSPDDLLTLRKELRFKYLSCVRSPLNVTESLIVVE